MPVGCCNCDFLFHEITPFSFQQRDWTRIRDADHHLSPADIASRFSHALEHPNPCGPQENIAPIGASHKERRDELVGVWVPFFNRYLEFRARTQGRIACGFLTRACFNVSVAMRVCLYFLFLTKRQAFTFEFHSCSRRNGRGTGHLRSLDWVVTLPGLASADAKGLRSTVVVFHATWAKVAERRFRPVAHPGCWDAFEITCHRESGRQHWSNFTRRCPKRRSARSLNCR